MVFDTVSSYFEDILDMRLVLRCLQPPKPPIQTPFRTASWGCPIYTYTYTVKEGSVSKQSEPKHQQEFLL
jgi:hypothetical protein